MRVYINNMKLLNNPIFLFLLMPNDSNNSINFKNVDEDGYNSFIDELLGIIEESPPGMQARFARAIKYLKRKKKIAKSSVDRTGKFDPKKMHDELVKVINDDIELIDTYGDKFEVLMMISKLREIISQNKLSDNK